eukprot:jgi/Botrbrau1/14904/Bobra.0018s0009.1
MTCFRHRCHSLQELAYKLCGIAFTGTSRIVETLCVARPDNRPRLVDRWGLAEAHENDPDSPCPFSATKLEFYRFRPQHLEDVCLLHFVRDYDLTTSGEEDQKIILSTGQVRYVPPCSKQGCVRNETVSVRNGFGRLRKKCPKPLFCERGYRLRNSRNSRSLCERDIGGETGFSHRFSVYCSSTADIGSTSLGVTCMYFS